MRLLLWESKQKAKDGIREAETEQMDQLTTRSHKNTQQKTHLTMWKEDDQCWQSKSVPLVPVTEYIQWHSGTSLLVRPLNPSHSAQSNWYSTSSQQQSSDGALHHKVSTPQYQRQYQPPVCSYSSAFSLFFLCLSPSLAAHLNPRLSEAESGVLPILQDTQSEASLRRKPAARALNTPPLCSRQPLTWLWSELCD